MVGLTNVLLLNDSEPAKVASVPVVGKVTLVVAVAVNVVENAPDVAKVEPSTNVKLAELAGVVIVILLSDVAVATPNTGVTNVLLLNDSEPAKVASVPVVGKVTLVVAVAVNVVE